MLRPLHSLSARASLVLLASLVACDARLLPSGERGGVPAAAERPFTLRGAFRLDESSAAALSAAHPQAFYTINDSGNDPVLYAFDTTGGAVGRWVVRTAGSDDWEALAVAPCARSGGDSTHSCVYIGDVGDNRAERRSITIYRVVEPDSLVANSVGELFPDSLVARYTDGAHNVESMVMSGDGSLLLITKEPARGPVGANRPALIYRIAPRRWSAGDTARAELVDSLPIVPAYATRHTVTDAALDRTGRLLVVRTYDHAYLFAADSLTGRPLPGVAPALCDLRGLGEAQGEGVGVESVGARVARLLLTSEGEPTPARMVDCPIPTLARSTDRP
jgi:hypothetical protein